MWTAHQNLLIRKCRYFVSSSYDLLSPPHLMYFSLLARGKALGCVILPCVSKTSDASTLIWYQHLFHSLSRISFFCHLQDEDIEVARDSTLFLVWQILLIWFFSRLCNPTQTLSASSKSNQRNLHPECNPLAVSMSGVGSYSARHKHKRGKSIAATPW